MFCAHCARAGIAVGRPVTRLSPHRSRRVVFSHQALQEYSLPQSGLSPRNSHPRLRSSSDAWLLYLKVVKQFPKAYPIVAPSLTATIESLEQYPHGTVVELVQAGMVAVHAIVVVVATQFGVQLPEQVSMAVPTLELTPFGELLERASQFLARGAALEMGPTWSVFPPAELV